MESSINEYTIKSNIRRILYTHPDFKDCDPSSICRDALIELLWVWIYEYDSHKTKRDDIQAFLDMARKNLGSEAIVELGNSQYTITLPNTTWFIKTLFTGYTISLDKQSDWKLFEFSYKSPEENILYMTTFDRHIDNIHGWIDEYIAQKVKESMICDLIATSAKGIIAQLTEDANLEIPQIACIRGTPQRRVILYFADMDEKINCPLDYLRVRLLRRFGRIKR